MKKYVAVAVALATFLFATVANAQSEQFTVIFGGKSVGHVTTDTKGSQTTVDFDIKNNGRGPTITEVLKLGADGLPRQWTIKGATTFGSKVDERFSLSGARANWKDSTGKGSATVSGPGLYVGQSCVGSHRSPCCVPR